MAKQTSNSHKVLKGISSQTLVTIVLGVVEIVSFSIMSRLLTKQDFGYYAAISAIVTIFACFSDAGIGAAIIQRKGPTKRFIDNAFTLSLLFGSVVSFVLFASAGVLATTITDGSMTFSLQLMSITLLLNCLNSVNVSIMYRRLQFLQVGMINLISLVVTTIVAVVLAMKGYGYYAIITKAVMASVLTLILSTIFAKTRYSLALDSETFKQIFGFSGWLMASGLFRNLAHDIDKVLMSRLLSVASLGAYNRPKDFINQISTKLNGIFDTALFPVLSGIQDDKEKICRAFNQSLYFMNMFAMLLTLFFAVNSELIIRIFFGNQWMVLNTVTIVLSFMVLFNIDGRLADCFLRSLGMTKQQFYFRIFETVTNLVAVVVGAKWDILGVAIAMVISNTLLKQLKLLYVAKKIGETYIHVFCVIAKSWQFSIILIPICVSALIFLPHSMMGNIILITLFGLISILLFVLFPDLVGKQYKESAYIKIREKIIKKLK